MSALLFCVYPATKNGNFKHVNIENMKKIILYIAASIDGYIADTSGTIEWLTGFPNPEKTDYGYKDLLASVDMVIMGGKTYRELLNMDVIWPYKQ